MFKVNNRNTIARYRICSKLAIKTPERPHCHLFRVSNNRLWNNIHRLCSNHFNVDIEQVFAHRKVFQLFSMPLVSFHTSSFLIFFRKYRKRPVPWNGLIVFAKLVFFRMNVRESEKLDFDFSLLNLSNY